MSAGLTQLIRLLALMGLIKNLGRHKTLELIYMSPLRARQKTALPLALKLWLWQPAQENTVLSPNNPSTLVIKQ
jgi:hypothetical protein